ncbi:hypothetical protein PoB_007077400 [Plakobranchus ocellatus]|uniref:Uncharacterized protein n=1 Tax=Plakobranchus ocellatus TaxID=259542 RepID=A0AAV4DJ85_9GAST|nr:hypothetical protein PoB_007077400 [Plakobranchus ocellatus]
MTVGGTALQTAYHQILGPSLSTWCHAPATKPWKDFTATIVAAPTHAVIVFRRARITVDIQGYTRLVFITSVVASDVPLQKVGVEGLILPAHVDAVILSANSRKNVERHFSLHEQLA